MSSPLNASPLSAPKQTLSLTGPVERAGMPLLPTRTVLVTCAAAPWGRAVCGKARERRAHERSQN